MTTRGAAGLGLLAILVFAAATLGITDVQAAEKNVTVTGEVIDTFCYAAMGARGATHKQCGIDCAKKGIPVGILEKDEKIHILLPTKDKTSLPDDVINKMGETVTVTGHSYSKGGVAFLTVESVK